MGTWVAKAKLAPRVRSGRLISRQGVLQALGEAASRRAILVHAPAGYGKTIALAQWWEALKGQSVHTSWLTLDQYDAKPGRFLAYLSASCLSAGFSIDRELPKSLREVSRFDAENEVPAFTSALQKCEGRHIILLDNFHHVDVPETAAIVHSMLTDLPRNFQIVVASRKYPGKIGLADFLAHDDAVVITEENLRFTPREAEAYLQLTMDCTTSGEVCETLVEQSEGWPIAIQLYGQHLRGEEGAKEALRRLNGRNTFLSDYFTELVFESQSEEVQEFLLKTAILNPVNGDLANHVCGIRSGWEILERLSGDNLFVRRVGEDGDWYAYHRLFQQYLEARALRKTTSIDSLKIYAEAAAWCLENDDGERALNYARLSRSSAVVGTTLEALGGWQYVVGQGNIADVRKAIELVDAETLRRFPRVWLAKIYLDLKSGEPEEAEREFRFFSKKFNDSQAERTLVDGERQVFRSLVSVYCDHEIEPGSAGSSSLDALERKVGCDQGLLEAVRCNLLCVLYGQHGKFEQANRAGDRAIEHFRRFSCLYGEVFVLFHQGYLLYLQGRLRQAWVVLMEGYTLATESFGRDSDLNAIGGSFLARVAYERNDCVRAAHYLETALPHIERFDAWLEVYISAYATAFALAVAEDNDEEAGEVFNRAISTATARGLPRLAQAMSAYFRCHQLQKAIEEGGSEGIIECDLSGSDSHPLTQYYAVCVIGWQMLAQSQFALAAKHFTEHAEAARGRGQMRDYVSLMTLQAISELKDGRRDDAQTTLGTALVAGAADGIKRPFMDQGTFGIDLLDQLNRRIPSQPSNRLQNAFLKDLLRDIESSKSSAKRRDNLLTPREREALRGLMENSSNQEIADSMAISVNTVKFHLKNIFIKLEADSRRDVVSAVIRNRLI